MSAPECRKIREGLSAYLEGDLDPAETSASRAHLEQCADCRAELELQRLTIGALRCLPDLPPPAGILAGVRARLEPEPWHRRLAGGRRWLLGVPVGAVATVLVVIGVSLFQSRFTETEMMGTPAPLPTYPQPAATAEQTAPQVPTVPAVRTAPPVPTAPTVRSAPAVPSAPIEAVAPERKADRLAASAPASAPIPSAGGDRAAKQAPIPIEPIVVGKVESRVDKPLPPAAEYADESAKDANEQFRRQKMVAAAPSLDAAGPEPQAAATGARSLDDRVAQQPERALVRRDRDFAVREESDARARSGPGIVYLLLPDGGTVDEIKRLLERTGDGEVKLEALAPSAVREAFAPHRGKPGLPREAAGGWNVTARVQAQRHTALLEELAARPGLRILEKPADIPAPVDPTEMLDLKLIVLH